MADDDHAPGPTGTPAPGYRKPRLSYWRKLGGGSLTFSVIIHVILLCVGAIWILRIIPAPTDKVVDFMPAGGGGGEPASNEKSRQRRALMMRPNLSRVVVEGVAGPIMLPEQDETTRMATLGQFGSGGMSGGLGGGGTGGGKGGGNGKGFGGATGIGAGMGGGLSNPFGMIDPSTDRLKGYIYDLHQTNEAEPNKNPQEPSSASGREWVGPIVTHFIDNGWRETKLDEYFRGPAMLGVSQILIPRSVASAAPEAFQAGDKMKGGAWVAVYRGQVVAPETAEIRFLGSADNYIALRWDKKNILGFDCGRKPSETVDLGLRMPMAVGDWIKVKKGTAYDIAILIGDAGGLFSACLYYEKKDEPGKRFLFRTEVSDFNAVLATDAGDMPKNFETDSPAWLCKPSRRTF